MSVKEYHVETGLTCVPLRSCEDLSKFIRLTSFSAGDIATLANCIRFSNIYTSKSLKLNQQRNGAVEMLKLLSK